MKLLFIEGKWSMIDYNRQVLPLCSWPAVYFSSNALSNLCPVRVKWLGTCHYWTVAKDVPISNGWYSYQTTTSLVGNNLYTLRCPHLQTAIQNEWPTAIQLHSKLYGSNGELEKMATFILQTGLSLVSVWQWPRRRISKKKKEVESISLICGLGFLWGETENAICTGMI